MRFSVFFHYFGPETAKLYATSFSCRSVLRVASLTLILAAGTYAAFSTSAEMQHSLASLRTDTINIIDRSRQRCSLSIVESGDKKGGKCRLGFACVATWTSTHPSKIIYNFAFRSRQAARLFLFFFLSTRTR